MFDKVAWQDKAQNVSREETTDPHDSNEKEASKDGITVAEDEVLPTKISSEAQTTHNRRSSSAPRRSSVVLFEIRRPSATHASVSRDGTGDDRTKGTFTGQIIVSDRKRSIYSIKAAQNSNDTDITEISEERLPGPAQDLLQEQTPGQYSFTVTEHVEHDLKDEKATVNVEVSPLQYTGLIATKASLGNYMATHPLPENQGSLRLAKFRYGWLTVYRRLFAIVFGANIIALIVLASRDSTRKYDMAAIGVGSNIFASVLARHDNLINAVISIIHFVPLSWPLWIRRRLGKIYCHAGIHSACGSSAAVWYLYFIVLIAIQPMTGAKSIHTGIFITAAAILMCLLILIGMFHPTLRGRYHDHWENTHRYIGWLLTAIIWAQVLLLCAASPRSFGSAVGTLSAFFWLVLGVTILLVYPWAMMRNRTYIANQLSSHALHLEFSHKLSRTGHNIRLASSALSDWHGFATIPRADGSKGFSVIISNAGDWTRDIISSC